MRAEDFSFLDVSVEDGVCVAKLTHPDPDHTERAEWPRLIDAIAEHARGAEPARDAAAESTI